MTHPQLERYVETIASQLKSLPPAQRDEEVQEIRQHLDALVAGHCGAGLSEDEAVKLAIRQFGHAKQVGEELCQVSQPQRRRSAWMAIGIYLFSVTLILLFFVTANDKPMDFPYEWGDQVLLACILPASILVQAIVSYIRTRNRRNPAS